MLSDILAMIRSAIDAASSWLLDFFEFDSEFYPFFITFFTIALVWRFIVYPLFGQHWGGSDRVRRERRGADRRGKEE